MDNAKELKIEELRADFSRVEAELSTIVEKDELTEDEAAKKTELFAKLDAINGKIEDFNKLLKYKFDNGVAPAEPAGKREAEIKVGESYDRAEFGRHATEWARSGQIHDRNFATITTGTSSGIMLPKSISTPLLTRTINPFRAGFKFYGLPTISTPYSDAESYPCLNMVKGSSPSESANSGNENAPAVANSVELKPTLHSSDQAWFSNTMIGGLRYDILDHLLPEMEYANELAFEYAGVAKVIAATGHNTVTLGGIGVANYTKLAEARRKGPSRYDVLKIIILRSELYASYEGLLADDGRPVFLPDPQNQELLKFNGIPVFKSDYFGSASSANAVVGCVLSLAGTKLRDAGNKRLVRYTADKSMPDQTGFELFSNADIGWIPTALTKIVNPGT